MSSDHYQHGKRRGLLMAIGGAEDKVYDRHILRRFVLEAGGPDARIAIFPTASRIEDAGSRYAELFHSLEADETRIILIRDREEALYHAEEVSELLKHMTGIFFSGGNQLRLSTILGGTKIAYTIHEKNANGTPVAGTSAGASLLCEHMIAFGQPGLRLSHGMVTLAPGLGLTNRVIFDQHFRQRDRIGRLMTAVTYNPYVVGVGVDEDTAALIDENSILHVIGAGNVTIVDASESSWTNMDEVVSNAPLALLGARVHVLVAGCTYNLDMRRPYPPRMR